MDDMDGNLQTVPIRCERSFMDLLRRPNKVRLGDYGFMDTGYNLSRFRNYNIYIVLLILAKFRLDYLKRYYQGGIQIGQIQ